MLHRARARQCADVTLRGEFCGYSRNVDASYFASAPADPTTVLQNALARLGATHLVESEDVLPSERVAHVNEVVREALVDASQPCLLTALAPVLVARLDA